MRQKNKLRTTSNKKELLVVIEPELHTSFKALCGVLDLSMNQVVRNLIRYWVKENTK